MYLYVLLNCITVFSFQIVLNKLLNASNMYIFQPDTTANPQSNISMKLKLCLMKLKNLIITVASLVKQASHKASWALDSEVS